MAVIKIGRRNGQARDMIRLGRCRIAAVPGLSIDSKQQVEFVRHDLGLVRGDAADHSRGSWFLGFAIIQCCGSTRRPVLLLEHLANTRFDALLHHEMGD